MTVPIGKLVVVGVGLIGGSFALALREARHVGCVVGVGRTRANLDAALARGIVDRAHTLDSAWTRELADADLVLLAAPVAQLPDLFASIAPALGARTVVTDAGSTKQDVIAAARAALGAKLPRYVPAHPIAGTEHTGAAAAFPTLYRDRNVVVTPLAETDADALALVADAWRACGAQVRELEPARHDRIFAAVSHLPHVLAFALVRDLAGRPDASDYFGYAASGFRDFTRIAGSSPEMWRDIALANRDALLAEIAAYREALDALSTLIAAGDAHGLDRAFSQASEARRAWDRQRARSGGEAGADATEAGRPGAQGEARRHGGDET